MLPGFHGIKKCLAYEGANSFKESETREQILHSHY